MQHHLNRAMMGFIDVLCAGQRRHRAAKPWLAVCGACLVAMVASAARGQWTYVDLHPAAGSQSAAYAVGGGQQAGWWFDGPTIKAAMWSGTSGSFVDLQQGIAGAGYSQALGAAGGQQVGYINFSGNSGAERACLWSGSAASVVYLHPANAFQSYAYATTGTQQIGSVNFNFSTFGYRAVLWNGSANSYVDLSPPGSLGTSYGYCIGDGQQGGQVLAAPGYYHAAMWTGTAASWVDLAPPPAAQTSVVWGVGSGQQVGSVNFGGAQQAVVWSGTAASCVFLNPFAPIAYECVAYGCKAGYQVGFLRVEPLNYQHASIWHGTAASWFDLHSVLGAGYRESVAYGISTDGVNLYVSGFAYPTIGGGYHAILWTLPLTVSPAIVMNSPSVGGCDGTGTLTVTIDSAPGTGNIAGGQFFVGWDASRLSLSSVAAGSGLNIFYDVANGGGRDLAVRIPDGGATVGVQTMATLTFSVSGAEACGLSDLVYFRSTAIPSRLTDNQANAVGSGTTNLGPVTLDRVAPVIPALSSLAYNTDAGFCRARRTLSVTATDVCAGAVAASASVGGNPITFPYDFPPATTTVTWSATDGCGNTSTATQDIVVTDNEAPSITCPASFAVNADVGGTTATLSAAQVGTPVTGDNCAVASVTPRVSGNVISFPYTFGQGATTITWTVVDVHGNTNSCAQSVAVNAYNTMFATVELDGVSAGPFTRCITFALYRGGCAPVTTVTHDLVFVGGIGTASVDVLSGALYTDVTVTDTLHTLRRTSGPTSFGAVGVNYFATFTTATGKKLLGGNFNNDAFVDILDFGGFIGQLGANPGASTPCGYGPAFRHADFSGDGVVGAADYGFISFNFLRFRDVDPCGGAVVGGPNGSGPLASVSIYDVRVAEIPGMVRADVNHDGVIDAADLAIVAAHGLPMCPADFNDDGAANVQDIFDYLAAWFIGHPGADVNGVNGVNVQDIFDFLGAWFAGCP